MDDGDPRSAVALEVPPQDEDEDVTAILTAPVGSVSRQRCSHREAESGGVGEGGHTNEAPPTPRQLLEIFSLLTSCPEKICRRSLTVVPYLLDSRPSSGRRK